VEAGLYAAPVWKFGVAALMSPGPVASLVCTNLAGYLATPATLTNQFQMI